MSSNPVQRPLSPHLQVWKWTMTMTLSILHRASGVALAIGTLMLVWMLVAAASGEIAYNQFRDIAISPIGQVLLFGWTGALYFHMCSGIRHLLMDAGYLLTIKQADRAGKIIFVVAIGLTLATWGTLKTFHGDV